MFSEVGGYWVSARTQTTWSMAQLIISALFAGSALLVYPPSEFSFGETFAACKEVLPTKHQATAMASIFIVDMGSKSLTGCLRRCVDQP